MNASHDGHDGHRNASAAFDSCAICAEAERTCSAREVRKARHGEPRRGGRGRQLFERGFDSRQRSYWATPQCAFGRFFLDTVPGLKVRKHVLSTPKWRDLAHRRVSIRNSWARNSLAPHFRRQVVNCLRHGVLPRLARPERFDKRVTVGGIR